MLFIPENIIEELLNQYEQEDVFTDHLQKLLDEQPTLKTYLDDENLSLLTKDELSLLTYLCTVIYHASKQVSGYIKPITASVLEQNEENNWDTFNSIPSQSFTKKLDHFFKDYPQEDLLALVEDSIAQDDEGVTSVGAEIIFISCKSWIDSLHHSI